MTRNPFADGTTPFAAQFNSLSNAHLLEGVLEGATLTPGDGDFDVDIGEGIVSLGDSLETLESTTVSVDAPDAEDRLDLLSTDGESVGVTTGDPATDPGQPIGEDTPEGEVVLGAIYVRGDAAELLQGDLLDEARTEIAEMFPALIEPQGAESGLDADTLRGETPETLTSPIYGDGSDGDRVIGSDVSDSGVYYHDRFELEAGQTLTLDGNNLIIHAREEIVIDGTINGRGAGGAGGAGGDSSDSGEDGEDGDLVGSGGVGGDGSIATNPGSGSGGSQTLSNAERAALEKYLLENWNSWYTENYSGGAGGGGGEGGSDSTTGGDGGDGAGVVVLIAPSVLGDGLIDLLGEDGEDGESSGGSDGGAGGGGGGCGGFVFVAASKTDLPNISINGGTGGAGGNGADDGQNGSDGRAVVL